MKGLDPELWMLAVFMLMVGVSGTFIVSDALRRKHYYRAAFLFISAVLLVLAGRFIFFRYETAGTFLQENILWSPTSSSSPAALP